MSYYPPGVTGNEDAIAGPRAERDTDEPCPICGDGYLSVLTFSNGLLTVCNSCDYSVESDFAEDDPPEIDPDDKLDDDIRNGGYDS